MKMLQEEQSGNVRLALSGECTIYDTQQMHREFLDLCRDGRQIEVDFSGVTEMDTPFFQLLIALKKERRSVLYTGHTPPVLKLLDLYGLAGFFGDSIRLKKDERSLFPFAYGIKREREGANNES
ncbi:MAG: STAS domain-containing protein [Spirochaetota bacterium]